MRPGPIQDLFLAPTNPEPMSRIGRGEGAAPERGFYVDLTAGGDQLPAIVVYGSTEEEAKARADQVLAALRLSQRLFLARMPAAGSPR